MSKNFHALVMTGGTMNRALIVKKHWHNHPRGAVIWVKIDGLKGDG